MRHLPCFVWQMTLFVVRLVAEEFIFLIIR